MTPVQVLLAIVVLLLCAQRLVELRIARRNEEWARAHGAVEHGARHYPLFFLLHGGWLIAFPVETLVRGAQAVPSTFPLFAVLFLGAQALRVWALATLGRRWNTRVLVLPGAPLVAGGPYRFVRHPNYVAVVIELLSVPLLFGAVLTAVVASALNAALLLLVRIPCEERALAGASVTASYATRDTRPRSPSP